MWRGSNHLSDNSMLDVGVKVDIPSLFKCNNTNSTISVLVVFSWLYIEKDCGDLRLVINVSSEVVDNH
ncbi:hypothetical protein CRG98_010536 [Punica granatum]|uniref:Uncharacterized protein n=1 Tax=Punica granatum TaxID=22663 RepID=A0A2I0KKM4_PUNGR|nr:hypothetical protein CRG98_010536 [Punica granatum]